MTVPKLSRGQNLPLSADTSRIDAVIGWGRATTEVDASALLLGTDGKVGSDADFVFYNQPRSSNGAVKFEGSTTTGPGAQARISLNLTALPDHVHTVALAGSVATGSFGSLGALTLTIVDESGRPVAEYTTAEATTEQAFVFGEIYRRAGTWKIRAVGQGWDSGLAGLATDFGVDITDSDDAAPPEPTRHEPSSQPTAPAPHHEVGSPYRLWGESRSWYSHELTVADEFLPAIRSLFPADPTEDNTELTPDVELIPEPSGPRGPWAISVRAEGRTIGYLDDDTARSWAGPLRRIIASGYTPTTSSRISYREFERWDDTASYTSVYLRLDQPFDAAPLNPPPAVPYTILPRSAIVQVTKEQDHFDVLSAFVTESGHGILLVTLHVITPESERAKPYVEVRVGDQRIGQLTPQMSQRFAPMIQHLENRGLLTACWADITGSAVAAKVRIDGIKANEASALVLDGPPVTCPTLIPELSDPLAYDLTPAGPLLQPLPLIQPVARPVPPEPPDGSLVRFDRSGYTYLAVRRGPLWETTASGSGGTIDQQMAWPDLTRHLRKFDIATEFAPIDNHGDPRTRHHLAAIRFIVDSNYLAALNISTTGDHDGDWYTTVTTTAARHLPIYEFTTWPEISEHGHHIQIASSWTPGGP